MTIISFPKRNRLQPTGITEIADPNEARRTGESIANFGSAVQNVAVTLHNIDKATKNSERQGAMDAGRRLLRDNDDRIRFSAYQRTLKEDITAYEAYMEEAENLKGMLKGSVKGEYLADAASSFDDMRYDLTRSIAAEAIEFRYNQEKERLTAVPQAIARDLVDSPDGIVDAVRNLPANADNPLIDPDKKMDYYRNALKLYTKSAALGYAKQGKLAEAKEVISANSGDANFTAEEKQELMDTIEKEYDDTKSREFNSIRLADAELDMASRKDTNKAVSQIVASLAQTKSIKEFAEARESVYGLISQGKVSPEILPKVIHQMDIIGQQFDPIAEMQIREGMVMNESKDSLLTALSMHVAKGTITPTKANALFTALSTYDPTQLPNMAEAKALLDLMYGTEQQWLTLDAEKPGLEQAYRARKMEALVKFHGMVQNGARDAISTAIDVIKDGIMTTPFLPYLRLSDQLVVDPVTGELDTAGRSNGHDLPKYYSSLRASGAISSEQYLEALEAVDRLNRFRETHDQSGFIYNKLLEGGIISISPLAPQSGDQLQATLKGSNEPIPAAKENKKRTVLDMVGEEKIPSPIARDADEVPYIDQFF